MTDKLHCSFCGAELTINPHPFDGCVKARCVNVDCRYAEWTFPLEIWQALIDAQDALNKISDIKESVEGCCAEIQQKCLPFLFSIDRDMKLKIDKEVSAIDKYMSDIEEIIALKHGGLPLLLCKACNHLPNPPIKICSK